MKYRIERKSVEEILFRTFSASDWKIWLIVSLIGNRQPFSVIWSILEKPIRNFIQMQKVDLIRHFLDFVLLLFILNEYILFWDAINF